MKGEFGEDEVGAVAADGGRITHGSVEFHTEAQRQQRRGKNIEDLFS